MLIKLNKRRGQTTLEYAILIVIVIAALFTIQVYIKRGIQGRMKSATDDIGDQFSPGITTQTIKTSSESDSDDVFGTTEVGKGVSKSQLKTGTDKSSTRSETIVHGDEYWGTHSVSIGDDEPEVSLNAIHAAVDNPVDR